MPAKNATPPEENDPVKDFMFRVAGLAISFARYIYGRGLDSVWPEAVFAKECRRVFFSLPLFGSLRM
jgi:hypothetical protein